MQVSSETHLLFIPFPGDIFESEEEDDWEISSEYPEKQRESRGIILNIADWIIPGHGKMFKKKK